MSLSPTATLTYGSSLRVAPVSQTLERARQLGATLGISRVTDITRLDRIGIPVCVSVRPGAKRGSLCVNAGKGVTPDEARAGAWMEAIEFAFAEPGASAVSVISAPPQCLLDGASRPDAAYDFCPRFDAQIPLDVPMPCVVARELLTDTACLVPAERVFLPGEPVAPARWFGATSNGLASGNSLLEAGVHGLAEVIERDICSFHLLRDTSALVRPDTFPPPALALAARIRQAGLQLYVRFLENPFHLPCFRAVIADPEADSPLFINGGCGCHPHRQIALIRAICEAAQSRLGVIHGGRDDLDEAHTRFAQQDSAQRSAVVQQIIDRASASMPSLSYEDIVDHAPRVTDLPAAFGVLVEALARIGARRVCRVVFTPPDSPLHVVKILVPHLEECGPGNPRAGRRIKAFWEELNS